MLFYVLPISVNKAVCNTKVQIIVELYSIIHMQNSFKLIHIIKTNV